MVVKPVDFIASGERGLVQPALKCRGPEYLRIIYSPEYTLPENIDRLRSRNLSAKRSLALREFALGIEGLHRFVEVNLFTGCMNAPLPSWPWKASRSTQGSDRNHVLRASAGIQQNS